jgi:hypothetical protein
MSALGREVYGRMVTIKAFGPEDRQVLLRDAVDQFQHLSVMVESQKAYLQGTIEFWQARTNTKMAVAAERLAVIAAITLPITALSSVLGVNSSSTTGRTGYCWPSHWRDAGDVHNAAGMGKAKGLVLAAGLPTCLAGGVADVGCQGLDDRHPAFVRDASVRELLVRPSMIGARTLPWEMSQSERPCAQ